MTASAERPGATLAHTARRAFNHWRSLGAEPIALMIAMALLVIPTLLSVARVHWSTSNGAHGPIILISGLWLLARDRDAIRWRPGSISARWLALLAPLLLAYAYGRSFSMLGTESAALYLLLVLLGFFYLGVQVMRRLWFPLVYLGFLIKPPEGIVAELTQPLKIGISQACVELLHALGYPVAQSGVLIQIAQYELLVQQACAGLGSLITLLAMGLLYVHLTRPPGRWHAALLLAGIVPIALAANLLRVIALVLLTYHAGDAVAQSFLHDAAGLVTFSLSMLGMLALDRVLLWAGRQGQA